MSSDILKLLPLSFTLYTFRNKINRMADRVKDKEIISGIRKELRTYLASKGETYKSVAEKVNKKFNDNLTEQSINNKLTRGTIRYIDIHKIANVLGYEIKWV